MFSVEEDWRYHRQWPRELEKEEIIRVGDGEGLVAVLQGHSQRMKPLLDTVPIASLPRRVYVQLGS